ncbi:MAG: ribonuclease III [Oscillospiraceae bacterium]|nr:ribonuclease III [Oscillospiraceae bacterium]
MRELEERLGYEFRDPSLLRTALTHSSYANEQRAAGRVSNERLEFLGDSVLGMTVADHIYRHYGSMPEGRMTRLRAELVCEQSLHKVALRLRLGEHLLLGRGEEHSGGRERPSLLADAVEAVVAAMYLDSGMETAAAFINRELLSDLGAAEPVLFNDFKTALQELAQRRGQTVAYELTDEQGPDHSKTFSVCVLLNGETAGEGVGHTKKEAEQAAAGSALRALGAYVP